LNTSHPESQIEPNVELRLRSLIFRTLNPLDCAGVSRGIA